LTRTVPQALAVAPVTLEETLALKALANGDATPFQQKLALALIMKKFSRVYDIPFLEGSSDGSAFLMGRGFVGNRIDLHLKQSVSVLHPEEVKNES